MLESGIFWRKKHFRLVNVALRGGLDGYLPSLRGISWIRYIDVIKRNLIIGNSPANGFSSKNANILLQSNTGLYWDSTLCRAVQFPNVANCEVTGGGGEENCFLRNFPFPRYNLYSHHLYSHNTNSQNSTKNFFIISNSQRLPTNRTASWDLSLWSQCSF